MMTKISTGIPTDTVAEWERDKAMGPGEAKPIVDARWHDSTTMNIDDLADLVFGRLGVACDVTLEIIKVALSDIALFDKKQRDYGPTNIATTGERGIYVRCVDKLARLKTLVWEALGQPVNESVVDSWQDLGIYSMIARVVRAEKWSK